MPGNAFIQSYLLPNLSRRKVSFVHKSKHTPFRDTSPKGRTVQGTRRKRDASTKGQGTRNKKSQTVTELSGGTYGYYSRINRPVTLSSLVPQHDVEYQNRSLAMAIYERVLKSAIFGTH